MTETLESLAEVWAEIRQSPAPPKRTPFYAATRRFQLGNLGGHIEMGMRVSFDGRMLGLPGRDPIEIPQLRAAIELGWLVPV